MSAHPVSTEVDLVVIGTGPGGEALANGAASAGLEVVAVEKHLVGGECPYYGCIPTKMMVRGSDAIAEVRRSAQVAGEATVAPAWSVVARRIDEDATTGWDAVWTSNTGEGGDLQAKVVNATTNIPVIEVQSRVSEIG